MKNNIINKDIIEKNGEIFYLTRKFSDDINSNSLKDSKSFSSSHSDRKQRNKSYDNSVNESYLKHENFNEKNKEISSLSNKYKNKDKNLKIKISLDSNLSKKDFIEKDNKKKSFDILNEKIANIMPISIRFYKIFIKKLIYELNENNDINNANSETKKNILINNIQKFKRKIILFKKYILNLIVKKHYLNSYSKKMELIKNKSIKIEKHINNIYDSFKILKNSINSIKDINKRKESNKMIFNFLKRYEDINLIDIKYTKKLFNKRKKSKKNFNCPENISQIMERNIKAKLFMKLSLVILPLVYIINFLSVYQKDYSLIDPIYIN